MPLSLFRLLVAALASISTVHASSSCKYSMHATSPGDRVLAGLREAVSQGPSGDYARAGDAGGRVSVAPEAKPAESERQGYVVGVVTRGRFILKEDGKPPRVLGLGETFFEPADAPGLRLDSASPSASARMVGVYLPKAFAHRARRERS
ncbi:hypothetical protein [Phenylobacterium montanum]|uniref:Uncharacterized protein n=1 Tax=Phenylobacterium montanum TaxID=2823693 RepID=A0A975G2K1_9CAUL|nr:hypothetical protein [Caulobacter sp. S6]QUD89424.1 hypothetical protein KCG34_05965 [Caulobacter sp. S6]